jgi:salicylate hydroxylase
MKDAPIVIAGAGIAGLSAALAGWERDVLIVEKTPAFEPLGAGLQIGPNAVSALQVLGAWDAVEPITNRPPEIHIRDGISGRILKRLKLGQAFEARFGAPYRTAHRADLHAALLDVVRHHPHVNLQLGDEVVSRTETPSSLNVLLGSGTTLAAHSLVGADGVHSKVRRSLFPDTNLIDSGSVFHRALIAMVPLIAGVEFNCVNLWLLPGGHVVHYPVGRDMKLNIVAITPKSTARLDAFPRAADQLKQILALVEQSKPWDGYYLPQLPQWHTGRTVLIGDAAHATLPYLAQGAALALEDSACLKQVLKENKEPKLAFAMVSTERRARVAKLYAATLRNGRIYHMQRSTAWARNMVLRALPESVFLRQLDWLYRARFNKLS